MNKRKNSFIISMMAIVILISQAVGGSLVSAQVSSQNFMTEKTHQYIPFDTNRLSGEDRYETAIAIAKKYIEIKKLNPYYEPIQTVILVSGLDYPDALSATPLAGACGAPILLTQPDTLTPCTLQALKEFGIKKVIIVGGTAAVSDKVENTIKAQSILTERIAGSDRFGTSVKVAKKIDSLRGGLTPQQIVIASGSGYADALSIAPYAEGPILLTNSDSLPKEVQDYIISLKDVTQSYVVGGNKVISDNVKNKLPKPIRLGGVDRYDTNFKIIEYFYGKVPYVECDDVFLASGLNYPDALTGAVLAGNLYRPLVLVNKTMPTAINNYLGKKLNGFSRIVAFGGTAVVPDSVISEVKNNISQDGIDMANDVLELKIGYVEGDSEKSVTSNITLPTSGKHGSTIEWFSDNPDVISKTGSVARPLNEDVEVELFATVKKGEAYHTEYFTLVVKKR